MTAKAGKIISLTKPGEHDRDDDAILPKFSSEKCQTDCREIHDKYVDTLKNGFSPIALVIVAVDNEGNVKQAFCGPAKVVRDVLAEAMSDVLTPNKLRSTCIDPECTIHAKHSEQSDG